MCRTAPNTHTAKGPKSPASSSAARDLRMPKFVFVSLSLVLLLLAALLSVDPFRLSILSNDPAFVATYVQQPPASQLLRLPRDRHSRLRKARKWFLDDGLAGPESLVLDPAGKGPYTGVSDGRIMRWDGVDVGWREFAYTSPNRSRICDSPKTMVQAMRNEHICGRPLGLRFDRRSADLYIADAYFGLLVVKPDGGQAKRLTGEAGGVPLMFTNDLDIASDGTIFFTESSSKYQRRDFLMLVVSGEKSGRVLKYNPNSGKTTVVLKGLQFPNGVALSKDESFLVIAESVPGRLLRHWLKGSEAGTTEVMVVLPGHPDNVRRNGRGEYWVAMHCRRNLVSAILGALPWLRKAFLQLPIPYKQVYQLFNGAAPHGIVAKYSEQGELIEMLEDIKGEVVKYASEVEEREGGVLWIGSVLLPYVSVYERAQQFSGADVHTAAAKNV